MQYSLDIKQPYSSMNGGVMGEVRVFAEILHDNLSC